MSTFKQQMSALTLIPSSGGCFEVTVDGALVYSKLQVGAFPDEKPLLDQIAQKLAA